MWQQLTYPKKVYTIMGIFILFAILSYNLVFSKTVALYKEIPKKQEKLNWLKEKEKEIPLLQSQMALLDKAYLATDSSSIRDILTAFISDFAEQHACTVTEIPEKSYYSNSELNVQTNQFVIEGRFKELLQLLYSVEMKYNYTAKVVSFKFYSRKDLQTKQTHLYLSFITQSFKQKAA